MVFGASAVIGALLMAALGLDCSQPAYPHPSNQDSLHASLQPVAWMLGEWEGEDKFMTQSGEVLGKTRILVRPILGGRHLEATFNIARPEDKVEGRLIISADEAGSWTSLWVESGPFPPLWSRGGIKDGGIELLSEGSKIGQFRTTWRPDGREGAEFILSLKRANDWFAVIRGRYKRPKSELG